MNTVVVYYSLEGNTKYAAERIASILGADLLPLVPKKTYPKEGFRKFLWGGKSALMAETPELEAYRFDASRYDRVILGFPVWASRPAPPIRTFLKENDLSGKRVAAFACESGSGAEKALARIEAALGETRPEATAILIDPKEKPSEENEAKLAAFCASLSQDGA